uniref:Glycoside hydrolase 131 catalytic N-terminal domain-containing protein n=1 Tax=Phytophthora ramorum TaxID=164328 RepID=H3H1E1_PHYRM
MVLSSAIFGMAALASSYLVGSAAAADEPLPWDGRGYDLTVDTLTDKYLTHILTMRNNGTDGKASDYVSVTKDGRSPAFNGDTGVIDVSVDATAIFKTQTNFRRSELVQNIAANTKGTTFFRTSVMKEEAFLNPYAWQMIFPESHIFEIRVDATASPAKIIYLNNGTWDAKWETEFVPGTWYNFGIGVAAASSGNGSVLEFYTSEGDKDLALEATHEVVTEFPSTYEFHYGLLTLSDDGSEPKMNAKPDTVSYNGVSVEADVVTSATSSVTGAVSTAGSIASEGFVFVFVFDGDHRGPGYPGGDPLDRYQAGHRQELGRLRP